MALTFLDIFYVLFSTLIVLQFILIDLFLFLVWFQPSRISHRFKFSNTS